jgi:anion transporter
MTSKEEVVHSSVHISGDEEDFDPLDMHNYRMENLPVRQKTEVEKWIAFVGAPLAILTFILIMWVIPLPFLQNIDPATLSKTAKPVFDKIGAEAFSNINIAMFAVFISAVILWITEAIPNYLTSLILIITLVFTKVLPEKVAYAQLGHKIMWLNILSFILASMLVATGAAKRFALWFIVKFGKNATSIFISFILINVVLSAFISATTAKAAILMPIFMVIAAVYGATGGKHRNNFGRNIVLQNLFCINIGAGAFVTGSGANLLAASLLAGAIGRGFFFQDWLVVAFPVSVSLLFVGWIIGTKFVFPLSKEEKVPHIEGGMETLKNELKKLGPLKFQEIKAVVLFVVILALWATDKYHGISPTAVAFVGAIVALLPKIGVVVWNEVDVPWHLLLFSAGAYTLGAGFKTTDLPSITVNAFFDALGLGTQTPFWVLYVLLTGCMMFSALIFQSKTMRTMIFVPIAIGIAQRFGFEVLSLALPVALLIEHVYVLPFNSKPALLLYSTDQYSFTDTFKFGFTMMIIGWITVIVMGETYYRFLGYTPNGVFGLF